MAIPFPGDEWVKAMMADLNASKSYEEAAKNWEGDIIFEIQPGGSLEKTVQLYMDLWHGKCRDAYAIGEGQEVKAAFTISAPVANWKKVMTGKVNPIQAMMTGLLKLRGNMAVVMKSVRAAKELVDSSTRIPTDFPL